MRSVADRHERTKTIVAGGLLGLAVAGGLALVSVLPTAVAEEQPFKTLLSTADELVPEPLPEFFKPDWTIEASVNTDIVKQQTVRKIGYGVTEFVTIVTTPTGTYSSDAVESPYVRYPGIHDTRNGTRDGIPLLGTWNGAGWTVLKAFGAGSFATVMQLDGGETFVHEDGICVFTDDGTAYC